MKISDLLRLAAKTKELVFLQPSTKTLRFLTGINAAYDTEIGAYTVLVKEPPQKDGTALIYHLEDPGRFTWLSVYRVKKDWQVNAFG